MIKPIDFFHSSEQFPQQSKTGRLSRFKVKILTKGSPVILTIGALFLTSLLAYLAYTSVKTIVKEPITHQRSIAAISILGCEGFIISLIICCICVTKKHFSSIQVSLSSSVYYQGSLSERFQYFYNQEERIKSKSECLTILKQAFQFFDHKGLLYKWMKHKNYANKEEALIHTLEHMQGGLCYGYSISLISLMRDHANLSSQQLIKKIDFEQIYYYQFIHQFLHDCFSDRELLQFFKELLIKDNQLTTQDSFHSFTPLLLRFLNVKPHEALLRTSNAIKIPITGLQLKDFIHKEIQQLLACNNGTEKVLIEDNITITGLINLSGLLKKELKEEPAGHVIFFQLNPHLRFHDSGHFLTGFYEYPTEDIFIDHLLKHLQSLLFIDARLYITLVGIPTNEQKINFVVQQLQDYA